MEYLEQGALETMECLETYPKNYIKGGSLDRFPSIQSNNISTTSEQQHQRATTSQQHLNNIMFKLAISSLLSRKADESSLLYGYQLPAQFEQNEIDALVENIFTKEILPEKLVARQITRGYAMVPRHLDLRKVKKSLSKRIGKHRATAGMVSVWTQSDYVIHWCIHVPMCLPNPREMMASTLVY